MTIIVLASPPETKSPRFVDWLTRLYKRVTAPELVSPIGVGVVPGSWEATAGNGVLQIGTRGAVTALGGGVSVGMMNNLRYDGTNYKYLTTAAAGFYSQGQVGQHVWYSVVSGTAGNTATLVEMMRLDENGNLAIGTAALATTATNGFLYLQSCAGAPTGVPTTKTGRVACVIDSTNSKLYAYIGGAWKSVTLT